MTELKSEFEPTKDTPYLARTGELCVYCKNMGENWAYYKYSTTLYSITLSAGEGDYGTVEVEGEGEGDDYVPPDPALNLPLEDIPRIQPPLPPTDVEKPKKKRKKKKK